MKDAARKGFVTLPAEAGREKEVLHLAQQWGADAIRDSDGTVLSEDYLNLDYAVYSTICLVRADQAWAQSHPDQLAQKFLMSDPVTAISNPVEIDLLHRYFRQKYVVDTHHNPKTWWEVIDRTCDEVVQSEQWNFNPQTGKVTVTSAQPFHVYTVNFLVYQIWDSVSMYNHLANDWQIDPIVSVDPYLEESRDHLMAYFDQWLADHPQTDVVRLTTLAYNFTLDSDHTGKDRYRDWLGYTDCVSPAILKDFERFKGYRLSSEDIVDQGYYNATYRVPTSRYLDWMDFIQAFVVEFGRDLVEKIHQAGKQAAIFWGDHWIGVEPYSKRFQEMKIDINIGACEDGVALRRLADAPGPQTKEIRLYPYFFPDVFSTEGDPLSESISNWIKIRRAMLRRCVDRIGYGGYPGLAWQFPEFVEHVTRLCDEFRTLKKHSQQTKPYTAPIKVYILNAWGALRSWLNNVTPDEKFSTSRPDVTTIAGCNVLECLSGLPVEVTFISFQEVAEKGIPDDATVVMNKGVANTAWNGGHWWSDERIVTELRRWIHAGGGFIGVGDPSAFEYQGRFYQLADVLGVQKETGQTMGALSVEAQCSNDHFILQDLPELVDLGVGKSFVYPCLLDTDVLKLDRDGHVHMAVRNFGHGRSVFISALPYSLANTRLLLRTLFWVGKQEASLQRWFTDNHHTECAYYPETGYVVVVNNTECLQVTRLHDGQGGVINVSLNPLESQWLKSEDLKSKRRPGKAGVKTIVTRGVAAKRRSTAPKS